MPQPDIITVDPAGDVVLHFQDVMAEIDQQYRCSRRVLRQKSQYFDVLFDPNKFSEGQEVESKLDALSKTFDSPASIPSARLPTVMIRNIGEISATEDHRAVALHAFLKMLHGETLKKMEQQKAPFQHFITLAALLAILAEQFAATECVKLHIGERNGHVLEDHGTKGIMRPKIVEAGHRQKLLVGMILGYPVSVMVSSAALIMAGSERWVDDFASSNDSLWYRLPHGIEEELQCRRDYILETISSLPSHFIGLYSSKQQQCKLGYDTSPQCDSFQLGEMIRFFTRKGLLRLQSTFGPSQDQPVCTDDITKVIEKLRQCPSYQLDAHHRHCGLRARLLSLLDVIWSSQHWGICMRCWNHDQYTESWLSHPVGGTWYVSDYKKPASLQGKCAHHDMLKAMYTAAERNWTSSRS